jgi:hypothetical protein
MLMFFPLTKFFKARAPESLHTMVEENQRDVSAETVSRSKELLLRENPCVTKDGLWLGLSNCWHLWKSGLSAIREFSMAGNSPRY